MNTDPIQILSIIKSFNNNIDVLNSKQSDLLHRIKAAIDSNKLVKIKKDLNVSTRNKR